MYNCITLDHLIWHDNKWWKLQELLNIKGEAYVDGMLCGDGSIYSFLISKKENTNKDDKCRQCGTVGKVFGMCCTCPKCGDIIWGI